MKKKENINYYSYIDIIKLSERDTLVLKERFNGSTCAKIGAKYGISGTRVNQIMIYYRRNVRDYIKMEKFFPYIDKINLTPVEREILFKYAECGNKYLVSKQFGKCTNTISNIMSKFKRDVINSFPEINEFIED